LRIEDCGLRIADLLKIQSAINPHSAILNPQCHYPVTAPNDADDTSFAYLASTPLV